MEKQEPEEPPKWFQAYAAVVGRLVKTVDCYHGKSRRIKRCKKR
jgi:hypothetical protein